MYIDALPGQEPTKTNTYSFYGLNRTRKGRKGEFEDMENMSTDEYPYASPTPKPIGQTVITPGTITLALPPLINITKEITGFSGIANEKFYYNGRVVSEDYTLRSDWDWDAVIMGDMYIINGVSKNKTENILYSYHPSTDEFSIQGAYMDKLVVTISSDTNGCFFENFRYLYKDKKGSIPFNEYTITLPDGVEMSTADFFVKYAGAAAVSFPLNNFFESYFKVGDEITISGFPILPQSENTQLFTYSTVNGIIPQTSIYYYENNTVDIDTVANPADIAEEIPVRVAVKSFASTKTSAGIDGSPRNLHRMYITAYNKNGEEIQLSTMSNVYCMGVKLALKKPALSQICTHNGRIFGTHTSGKYIYGGSAVILHDFSAESRKKKFAARLSDFTPGTFTGICEYSNLLLAFKEQSITVVGGDNPENYYTDIINGIGCIDRRSIAVTPQGVIFLSYNGIYRYSGNVPVCISEKLNVPYKSGTAGFDGQKYYLSAERADNGEKELVVYDTRYGLWHKYSDNEMKGMFVFKGQLWEYTSEKLYCRNVSNGFNHDWTMTSMRIYDYTLNRKAPESIWIKAELSEGASFSVETSTDDSEFVKHLEYKKPGLFVVQCPCRIKMGNYYRYRISGRGKVVFYELEIHRSESGREFNAQRQMNGAQINEAKPVSYQTTNPTPKYIY